MRILQYSVLLFLLFELFSCSNRDVFAEKQKSLDSLSGAVNGLVTELLKHDTLILQKAISKYSQYKLFIKQNVNDTLSKVEADYLKQFFEAGTNLENYQNNRKLILVRAAVINSQLSKLASDAKNKTVSKEVLSKYYELESMEANKLIQQGSLQQKVFYTSLQEFKSALNGVEQVIKSRNKGESPKIIEDADIL